MAKGRKALLTAIIALLCLQLPAQARIYILPRLRGKVRALLQLPTEPVVGERKACVLLARFADVDNDHSHTVAYFNSLLFGSTTPDGTPYTLANYFSEVSYGKLTITGQTYGWFLARSDPGTSPEAMATARTKGSFDDPFDFCQTMVAIADRVVDFSQFDADEDGIVDILILVYAGDDAPPTFSPYATSFTLNQLEPLSTQDGVDIDWFVVVGENWTVGAYCHETMHLFGLPDLYDAPQTILYSHAGTGFWSLMGAGAYLGPMDPITGVPDGTVPCHIMAWEKIALGWVEPIVAIAPGRIELPAVEEEPVVYKIPVKGDINAKEYFLIENRQKIGFDRYLPGEGLLIWHVDESVLEYFTQEDGTYTNWLQEEATHPFIRLVQADGRNDLGNLTPAEPGQLNFDGYNFGDDGDPFPGSTNNRMFSRDTNPSSRTYTGEDSGVIITDISDSGMLMTAFVGGRLRLVLLAPPDGSVTELIAPTVVVRVEKVLSDAPDLDPPTITIKVDSEVVLGEGVGEPSEAYNPETHQIRFTLPPLAYGQHSLEVTARDLGGNPAAPVLGKFFVQPRVLHRGLAMISVPYLLANPDAAALLALPSPRVARWDDSIYGYRVYPEEYARNFVPGAGYWVSLDSDITVRVEGEEVDLSRPFSIPVQKGRSGWTMIGDPFPFAVGWNSVEVSCQGRRLPLSEAVKEGWISDLLYWYEGGTYRWARAPEGVLMPWRGYWIKVLTEEPCELLIPPLPTSTQLRGTKVRARIWAELALESPRGADANNILAVREDASNGLGPEDVEKPPSPSPFRVALVREGRELIFDAVRSAREGWRLKVSGPPRVALRLKLRRIKGPYYLALFDPVAGREVALRPGQAYSFSLKKGEGSRVFSLKLRREEKGGVRILGLRLLPLKGGRAVAEVLLNRSGRIEVRLLTLAGRTVARSAPVEGSAGWNRIPLRMGDRIARGAFVVLMAKVKTPSGREARMAKVVVWR